MTSPLEGLDHWVGRPLGRLRTWWRSEVLRREIDGPPTPVRDALERETGLGPIEASRIVADHPGPARLMPCRLAAVGLDADAVVAEQPLLYRDMVRTCAKCDAWRRCERDLRYDDVRPARWDYCPNDGYVRVLKSRGCSVDHATDTR